MTITPKYDLEVTEASGCIRRTRPSIVSDRFPVGVPCGAHLKAEDILDIKSEKWASLVNEKGEQWGYIRVASETHLGETRMKRSAKWTLIPVAPVISDSKKIAMDSLMEARASIDKAIQALL